MNNSGIESSFHIKPRIFDLKIPKHNISDEVKLSGVNFNEVRRGSLICQRKKWLKFCHRNSWMYLLCLFCRPQISKCGEVISKPF